jgi:SET domain-containing protein
MILASLYVSASQRKGRGVFTSEDIPNDTLVEESPVIVMGPEDRQLLDQTLLHDYIFEWGLHNHQCVMALGYIALYNHDYRSNCEYEMDYDKVLIRVKTIRAIRKGEELSINYNGDWNNSKPVWFNTQ